MGRPLALAIISTLAVAAPAAAQTAYYDDLADGERRDIPCPATLSSHFQEDYSPIRFDEHDFETAWRSVIWHFPLASRNWYEATPARDVASVDNTVTWQDARIQVHCWVYRAGWLIRRHYDHIASSGRIVCPDPNRALGMWDEQFDPYAPDEVQMVGGYCEDDGGGGGGGGGSGGGTCTPMEIQVSYDGGRTWTTVWAGNVCESQ